LSPAKKGRIDSIVYINRQEQSLKEIALKPTVTISLSVPTTAFRLAQLSEYPRPITYEELVKNVITGFGSSTSQKFCINWIIPSCNR